MLKKYIKKNFNSYEDFISNFKIDIPDGFNFTYDVVDEWAAVKPEKTALVWCDDKGAEASFTFGQLKEHSDRTANFLKSIGICKGDPVMLILKRRFEFWFCILALHKLGAAAIPATYLLTTKDIIYRNNAAGIKAIVSVNEPEVINHIEESAKDSPTMKIKVSVGENSKEGWYDFKSEIERAEADFTKPDDFKKPEKNDIMLLYFTSGTTGMPKMARHNFNYPLGHIHIVTAKYWQNVEEDGLHLTVADTGWAKAAWVKIYVQWIAGCAVFVYDYDRFVPKNMLEVITIHNVTSFCSPPTVFRYFIKEDFMKYDFSKLKYCTVAGEPLNPEVYNQFFKLTGIRLMEGYGQTECTVIVDTFPWMEPKPGSMGKPSPGYDIDLVDENGGSCNPGSFGMRRNRCA